MRRLMVGAMVLAAGLAGVHCGGGDSNPTGPSTTGPIMFTAQMSAANEVPPVTNAESTARGNATVTMTVPRDPSGTPTGAGTTAITVQLTGFPRGTPVILGHIHTGAAGVNGPFVVNTNLVAQTALVLNDGTVNITFSNLDTPAAVAQAIYANPAGHYVNFHTPTNPGGAVRGQLVRVQ